MVTKGMVREKLNMLADFKVYRKDNDAEKEKYRKVLSKARNEIHLENICKDIINSKLA